MLRKGLSDTLPFNPKERCMVRMTLEEFLEKHPQTPFCECCVECPDFERSASLCRTRDGHKSLDCPPPRRERQ